MELRDEPYLLNYGRVKTIMGLQSCRVAELQCCKLARFNRERKGTRKVARSGEEVDLGGLSTSTFLSVCGIQPSLPAQEECDRNVTKGF